MKRLFFTVLASLSLIMVSTLNSYSQQEEETLKEADPCYVISEAGEPGTWLEGSCFTGGDSCGSVNICI